MLVQVVDVLDHALLQRAAHRHVVERRQVLDQLAQPDAAGVGADRHAELGRQQQDRQHLVDPAEPARVDLAEVDRAGLHQLLEHRPGCAHARRSPPGSARCARAIAAWPSTSSGLVGSSIHHGSKRRQRLHPVDRLGHAPRPGWRRASGRGPSRSPRGRRQRGACRRRGPRPTLILKCFQPGLDRLAAAAAGPSRRRSRASRPRWCRRGSRRRSSRPAAAARWPPGRAAAPAPPPG